MESKAIVVDEVGSRIQRRDREGTDRAFAEAINSIRRYMTVNDVDEAFPTFDNARGHINDVVRRDIKPAPVPARLLVEPPINALSSKPIANLRPIPASSPRDEPLSRRQRSLKRAFDIVGSMLGLVILAPVFVLIGVAIRIESPGPIIFRQRRTGFSGQIFKIYKFRTMAVMEDGEVVRQATRADSRVTRVGEFLRRTSLDEIPQLLNVLNGEMSLVGPRPHALTHDNEYQKQIATYALRQLMKPGITGWAQIHGLRGETAELALMERRVQHDLYYIGHWRFRLDLWILGATALRLLCPRDVY